jgi:organic radical activating enzyme
VRRLTFDDVEKARLTRGETALLFITDRCPVGCGHCSVDSRPDSPKVSDYPLFEGVVEALCASRFRLIGVSGGEPFVERRALSHVARRVIESGKELVVYTSGVWATSTDPPRWIREVIRKCSCMFLSTDAFHQAALADERFQRTARVIAGENVWIVVQVIDDDEMVDRAEGLLAKALGPEWPHQAEIHRIPLLPYGRASELFHIERRAPGRSFGPCLVARSPVVRYDGMLSFCCNESVIMGRGPDAYRRRCANQAELSAALAEFDNHAFFRAVGEVGPGVLTAHPDFRDLAEQRFRSICELCWQMVDRIGDAANDPVLTAASLLGKESVR